MRARFLGPFVALVLLVGAAGASAQSPSSQSVENKGIDPALLAKAKAGDADAEKKISLAYSRSGNQKEACRWMLIAAQNANAEAQLLVAEEYELGSNVCVQQKDAVQAVIWLRKAATGGEDLAAEELASHYYGGKGTPQDYSQAAVWYRKAAEQGEALAQWSLGSLYVSGHGVPQDYAEAYFWMDLAASVKIVGAEQEVVDKDRDEAASHLTPAELSRAQERARKWFENHPVKPQ